MLQRGRKSKALREHLAQFPHLVAGTPPDELFPPPNDLEEPEKELWREALRDWRGSGAAHVVLEVAMRAHQRARYCRKIIDADGMLVAGRNGQPKAHPLLSTEKNCMKLFYRVIKALGIKGHQY